MKKEKVNKQKTGLARLMQLSSTHPYLLILSVLLSSIASVALLVPYYSAYKVIEEVVRHAGDIQAVSVSLIMTWVIAGVACVGAGFLLIYLGSMCSHVAAFRILYGLRMNLVKKLTELPLGYHTQHSTGEIRKILELNVEKIEKFIAHGLPDYVSGVITVLATLVALFFINVWLALVFIAVIIIAAAIVMISMMGSNGMNSVRNYQKALENINNSTVQYVRGMPAVKMFNRSAASFRTLKHDIDYYRDWAIKYSHSFRPTYTIMMSILKGIAAFLIPVGIFLLTGNPASVPVTLTVTMFLILAPGIVAPFYKVVTLGGTVRDISGGIERIDEIFLSPPLSQPEVNQIPNQYDIRFDQVKFSYNEQADNPVYALKDISFSALSGKVTALVGPSGGGKSTCAQLVPRFFDCNAGSISIGGVDIRSIRTDTLNEIVSFVFQDSFLFFDTIRENIKVGKKDATEEDIIRAAKMARCHDFIMALPDGYDTLIGEGGVYLSGGEEQRVNIARAILKNAPILILDEATAFADSENEHLIYAAIKALIQNKTVIMIAHRLSTIINADQIIVIEDGQIAENGTHDQLLSAKGLYKKLFDAYMKHTEWTVAKTKSLPLQKGA